MRPLRIQTRRDYQQTLLSYLAREEVQAYTMAILSFFALAFFSVFAIRPTLVSFFTIQKQIEDATRVENKLDSKINSLLKAQENYQLYQNQLVLLDHAIPQDPQFPELVKKIEGIVNENEATGLEVINALSAKYRNEPDYYKRNEGMRGKETRVTYLVEPTKITHSH